MRRRKIQHLLYSGLGGHGSVFFSLVEADRQTEFEYTTVFCGIEDLRQDYIDNCNRLAIPYNYVRKKRGFDIKVYWHLFRDFRRNKPDVVFLHGVSFLMPAVWYKITVPAARIIVRDTQAHHLKSKAEWFWLFLTFLFARKLVLLTEASAEGLRKKFGMLVPRRKLEIIPNGLNIDKYKPVYRDRQPGELRVGMQSRLQPIKDHPTLLSAFKLLKDKNPDLILSLHIAGDGETLPSIKKLVEDLGLCSAVHLLGMLNEVELLNFMHSLDIYVHATFGETLSNSIMQAMACGLPIIASDVWGVNNMIENGRNGILYKGKDVSHLAAELEHLINDTPRRQALGKNARTYAEGNYSNESMFSRYKKLY